ncbi:MAG: Mth938-like domain-containing protein [Calditrichaeota bacterium]|nr:Mth938-like domain-containing protein [Calditrichota bacterium]
MRVESYRFGQIVIDGATYDRDLIIRPGGIVPDWWRKEGHKLQPVDIEEVLRSDKPELLIVGTGKYGLMRVLPETVQLLREHGVELVAARTDEAVEKFNAVAGTKRVVAAFHLTC